MPVKKKPPYYGVWSSMRDRCNNPNNHTWEYYGGRGIVVCSRWDSYALFALDMGERPLGFSLDRIDNNGPYSPENCRWASRKEQARNQSVTRHVIIDGLRYRAADLADMANVKTDTIIYRVEQGLSFDEVIGTDRRFNLDGLALGGLANGARQKAKTHCPKGHEYNKENTYLSSQGWRRCRRCKADIQLASYYKRRTA